MLISSRHYNEGDMRPFGHPLRRPEPDTITKEELLTKLWREIHGMTDRSAGISSRFPIIGHQNCTEPYRKSLSASSSSQATATCSDRDASSGGGTEPRDSNHRRARTTTPSRVFPQAIQSPKESQPPLHHRCGTREPTPRSRSRRTRRCGCRRWPAAVGQSRREGSVHRRPTGGARIASASSRGRR